MKTFEVLCINPGTKSPELMLFETKAEAQSHKRMAEGRGKLLVEIISSAEEHEEWRHRAMELVSSL
jgi:hypothetical protein